MWDTQISALLSSPTVSGGFSRHLQAHIKQGNSVWRTQWRVFYREAYIVNRFWPAP
jgi:hypothetical protein